MPSKNILKIQKPETFYHVYSRGVNRQHIFLEDRDFQFFTQLFGRHLIEKNKNRQSSQVQRIYPNYSEYISLVAYCLMPNHVHLFIYQHEPPGLEKFMRSIMTSYSRYFNHKYKRTGPLFEGRYRAVMANDDKQFLHITRYIHLNPKDWKTYKYSSYPYYKGDKRSEWLKPNQVIDNFRSFDEYERFLTDYEDHRNNLDSIKLALAGY